MFTETHGSVTPKLQHIENQPLKPSTEQLLHVFQKINETSLAPISAVKLCQLVEIIMWANVVSTPAITQQTTGYNKHLLSQTFSH